MKPIMFSRFYPAYHPKKGEPTFFVEKIWKCLWDASGGFNNPLHPYWQAYDEAFPVMMDIRENIHQHDPKYHTIRAGSRWKVGDFFVPKVWTGKPYRSKQIQIAPPIEVKKIWEFVITKTDYRLNGRHLDLDGLTILAKNDGLEPDDMELWFAPYAKKGDCICQVICWNDKIEY